VPLAAVIAAASTNEEVLFIMSFPQWKNLSG
jgi:hypothetical protein